MALYPIKLLKDKNQVPFFPFNTLESVLVNNTNKTLKDILDDMYTKEQVDSIISSSVGIKFEVVAQLPTTDIDTHTIYLVPKTATTNNSYDEYIYVNNSWELIGSTDVDLSGYQTLIDVNNKLSSDLVDDTNNTHLFVTQSEKNTWNNKSTFSGDYNDLTNKPTIPVVPTNVSAFTNDAGYSTFSGSYNDLVDKPNIPTVPTNVSAFINDAGYLTSHQDISGKEDKSNKVTSVDSNSTDTQYPSAKCLFDLTNDILHYKGHVANVSSLPSTGQASGTTIAPEWTYSNTALYADYLTEFIQPRSQSLLDRFDSNLGATYGIGTCYGWSGGYAMVYTDYPETIDGIYMAPESTSSTDVLTCVMVHVTPQPGKPVYAKAQGYLDNNNWNYVTADYDDGSGATAQGQIEFQHAGWFLIDKVSGVLINGLIGNLPNQVPFKVPAHDYISYANGSGTSDIYYYKLYNTIHLLANNTSHTVPLNIDYKYNDGMKMYEFVGLNTTTGSFVTNETTVKENDVYTVGTYNEIYRANSTPAWEQWGISKNYVDTAISTAIGNALGGSY